VTITGWRGELASDGRDPRQDEVKRRESPGRNEATVRPRTIPRACLCECVAMAPDRRPSWMPWLRVACPGAFVGYGVFLVSRSAILGFVAGLVVSVVCWVVLRPIVR
jgi:hypothetical protein